MKKIITFLAIVALICLLCSCGSKNNSINKKETDISSTAQKNTSAKKISGTITSASSFSEGLAFVAVNNNNSHVYCIDKNGEIVFELDNKIICNNGTIWNEFHNGYTLIDGAICDKSGKLTYPEDKGVTKFSLSAIYGNYIIAEINKTTFDSSHTKIGVMDLSYNWIVEPSKEIGEKIKKLPEKNDIGALSAEEYYYYDNEIYISDYRLYLNVKTGEISYKASCNWHSEKWNSTYPYGLYADYDGKVMLNLTEKYDNICSASRFINGRAAILFCNKGEYFLTVTNEKGEFEFEPVSCGKDTFNIGNYISISDFDGNNILLKCNNKEKTAMCYDIKGELKSKFSSNMFPHDDWNCTYSLSDGVVLVSKGLNNSREYYLYKPNGEKLF